MTHSSKSGVAFHWRIQPVINVAPDGRSARGAVITPELAAIELRFADNVVDGPKTFNRKLEIFQIYFPRLSRQQGELPAVVAGGDYSVALRGDDTQGLSYGAPKAVGRALLMRPRLLLLDEPLASLDNERRREILPYLVRLRDEVPMVYVSHHAGELRRIATSVVRLDGGRVVASGGIDLLADTDDDLV